MTAKEYLSRAYNLHQVINSDKMQIIELESLIMKLSSPQYGGAVTGGGSSSSDAAFVRKANQRIETLSRLKKELQTEIDNYITVKEEIAITIRKVQKPEHRALLSYRYLNFMKWEKIADEMGYGVRHVYKIHGAALQDIEMALNGSI